MKNCFDCKHKCTAYLSDFDVLPDFKAFLVGKIAYGCNASNFRQMREFVMMNHQKKGRKLHTNYLALKKLKLLKYFRQWLIKLRKFYNYFAHLPTRMKKRLIALIVVVKI